MKSIIKRNRYIIIISVVYLASQGMLLIASGKWWDDWIFHNQPYESLREMGMQMGRPSLIPIMGLVNALPESGYRILTFLMMYLCVLFLFGILRYWLCLEDDACLWICAIYSVIPANDCRIVSCVFPYTVGLFFFMAGLCFFSYILFKRDETGIVERVVSYVPFLLSFVLHSNLFMYCMIPLIVISKTKSIRKALKYVDYIILPLIFVLFKSVFFKPYGLYAGYNGLSVRKMITAAIMLIPADIATLFALIRNWFFDYTALPLIVVIVIFILILLKHRHVASELKAWPGVFRNESTFTTKDIKILAVGVIALSLGIFPYIIVRQSPFLETTGLPGRDSVLVAFGGALLVYGSVRIMINTRFHKVVFTLIILCGILFFNLQYMEYQRDYYRQLGFMKEIEENRDVLEDSHNILYISPDDDYLGATRFYVLNAIAEEVFDKQDKLIMCKVSDLNNNSLENFVLSGNYHMSDYDVGNKTIDHIVEYSMDIDIVDTIKMKMLELIGSNGFDEFITEKSSMVLYAEGSDKYKRMIESVNGDYRVYQRIQ